MLKRIICVSGLVVALDSFAVNEAFQSIRSCVFHSDRPELCLESTPALSRRRRFSEALPRRRIDRCALPCQKKAISIATHILRAKFALLKGVERHQVKFYHEDGYEVQKLSLEMCLGSCRYK